MRVRDLHSVLAQSVMLSVNIVTCLALCLCARAVLRDMKGEIAELRARVESAESACAALPSLQTADSTRLALCSDSPSATNLPPRVIGYGQTRSRVHRYVYRDVERDGVVSREFIAKIPLSQQ